MIDLPPPRPLLSLDGIALFLDLDGTLAPIAPRPSDVGPDPSRNALLLSLAARMNGRLAVVSGRSIADVDRILDHSVRAVAGLHGLERRSASGTRTNSPVPPGIDRAKAAFNNLAQSDKGLLVEDKGASVALHYRANPEALETVLNCATSVAEEAALQIQRGLMVVELRGPGPDKGDAIDAFLAEPPFLGTVPIFIGDDLTDEHGFAMAESRGGVAVLVGPLRPTAASRRLDDSTAVLAWLRSAVV